MTSLRTDRRPVSVRPARHNARETAAGLVAGLVLLALTVGLPLVLLTVAPLSAPHETPTWAALVSSLTRPDDGSLLRSALVVVAWGAWAGFAVSVLVEVLSVARRRPTPRIPLLRLPQHGAASLVALVVILLGPPAATTTGPTTAAVLPDGRAATVASQPAHPVPTTQGADPAPVGEPHGRARHLERTAHAPTIVVQRHDTLWGLAERHLGSGSRFHQIVELNRGRPQPDGRTLTDPHWIYPGWVLRLPADAVGPGVRFPSGAQGARQHPEREQAELPTAVADVDRGPATSTAPSARPAGTDVDRGTANPPPEGRRSVLAAAVAPDTSGELAAPLMALGLGAVTVAAVLSAVGRQRRTQQRVRRTAARIAMPAGSDAGAERLLRAVSVGPARRVRTGLALLADACAASGRALPQIALVRVATDSLELVLTGDDDAAVPPFVASGPRSWTWSGPDVPPPDDPDRVDPCPGLVSVGMDGSYLVLVNLEAAGALRVEAPPGDSEPLLAAMTVDLVTRARSSAVTVSVAADSALAELATGPQARAVPAGQGVQELAAHARDVRSLLAEADVADVAAARSAGVADDTWAPLVQIGPDHGQAPAPWSGAAVVTGAAVGSETGSGWSLRAVDGDLWRLEPTGTTVVPQRLDESGRAHVAALLARPAPPEHRWQPEPPDAEQLARLQALLESVRLPEPPPSADPLTAPRVLLLGPVEVVRADDAAIPGRVRRATELAAYLVLHPGASRHELDEVLWPGRRVGRSTRNPFISRTRQWLGRTPDGHAHLPLVGDEAAYRLLPVVGCDWHDFVRHALAGLATEPVDSAELTAALQLVRGRPFQGIDPSSYAWAEPDVQDIVSTVVDVAHVLAGRALEDGDAPAAARAAARGLLAEPGSETLHRDAIRAALLRGDRTDVERAVERMHAAFEALDLDDDDLMPETRSLIKELVPSRAAGQGRGRAPTP